MKNRIILLLTVFFLIVSSFSVTADTDMLDAFGITGEHSVSEPMKRIEFMKIISSVLPDIGTENEVGFEDTDNLSDDKEGLNAVRKLHAYGIIKGNGSNELMPDEQISEIDAVTMLIRLLGYESAAASSGYPEGYINTATHIGLFKGVSGNNNERIYDIICNALDITVMEQKNWGEDVNYEISEDKTVMNSLLKIETYNGILYSVGNFALSDSHSVYEGKAKIGNFVFEISPEWQLKLQEYIGQSVKIYYKENLETGNYDLVYFKGKADFQTKEILLKDIISIDGNVITYSINDADIRKITTEKAPYIIYNGRPVNSIGNLSKTGKIMLKGNDGKYSVIVIENYYTAVLNNVAEIEGKIFTDNKSHPIIDYKKAESLNIYNENKEKITLEELSNKDVLSVLESRDGLAVTIFKSSETVFGKITEVNLNGYEESSLNISGVTYGLTEEFFSIFANTANYLDITTDFYLDIFGNVAYMAEKGQYDAQIGYLIAFKSGKNTLDNPAVKIFTLNSKVENIDIEEEKFKSDGNAVDCKQFFSNLKMPCLVSYKLNKNGLLCEIEPAASSPEDGLYKFSLTTSGTYRTAPRSFDNSVICSQNTKVFVVPEDDSQDVLSSDYYSIENLGIFLNTYTYSNLNFYSTDKNALTSNYIVYKKSTSSSYDYSSTPMMFDKVVKSINSAGETVDEIYVYKNGVPTSYFGKSGTDLSRTNVTVNNTAIPLTVLEKGDIIRLGTNVLNEIGNIQLLYDRSEDKYMYSANPYKPSTTYKICAGVVTRMQDNIIEVYYKNTNSYEYYDIGDSGIVAFSETDGRKNIYTGSSESFVIKDEEHFPENPSKVFIFSSGNVPSCVYLY
ncbi:MAG: hypothetical protein IJC74_02195 [Clostridia bacterium]|nr:hypothetical protein [Clostridia bacterium]